MASQDDLIEKNSLKWMERCIPEAQQSWQPRLPTAVGCAQNKHKWMDGWVQAGKPPRLTGFRQNQEALDDRLAGRWEVTRARGVCF